jgi:glycosyltransferase involved in cell wall biosynthesis
MNLAKPPAPDVAVVIPCYRVGARVLSLIPRIGPEVGWIFVVDDACPEHTADRVEAACHDPRVRVIRRATNGGVGAAVIDGWRAALATPARVVVKLDGDGQMDPALVPRLVAPIRAGRADYAKGNRFHSLRDTAGMPVARLLGNAALGFMARLATGYWQLFDSTNGFVAIHREVLRQLPLERIAPRYFFESDVLYQLGQLRAVVCDMPMHAVYDGEPSSLQPLRMVGPFARGHLRNFARRLLYGYFIRGFSLASVELLLGALLLGFGIAFGGWRWWVSAASGEVASAGTVMLAGLPVIVGMQLLLSWLNFDVAAEPRVPLAPMLAGDEADRGGQAPG